MRASRTWVVLGLALQLSAAAPAWAACFHCADEFPTEDPSEVGVPGSQTSVVVSLNDDDDNQDGVRDRRAAVAADENNLLRLFFLAPGADVVFVAEPVFTANSRPALRRAVRTYQADRLTAFDHTKFHDLSGGGVVVYLEGIRKSDGLDKIAIEYQFLDAARQNVTGGTVLAAVIDVNARLKVSKRGSLGGKSGSGVRFDVAKKMLIRGVGRARAKIEPDVLQNHLWRYTAPARALVNQPGDLETPFTALDQPSPTLDADELAFRVSYQGIVIRAALPVNLTAPRHARADSNGFDLTTGFVDATCANFSLFSGRITYTLLDQFRQPIKTQTAYAGRLVQVRENIGRVLTSPVPRVRDWIQNQLRWTRNWKTKPNADIVDRLRATRIPCDRTLRRTAQGLRFHPSLREAGGGGILFELGGNTHDWEASVGGVGAATVTNNTFTVQVAGRRQTPSRDVALTFRSRYGVVTP